MNKTLLNIVYLLLAIVLFLCQPPSASADATTEYQRAVDQLVQVVQAHMTTLDRPMLTFHYQIGAPPGAAGPSVFEPTTIDDVKKRIAGRPRRFFDAQTVDHTMQGAGVYVAIDPAASRGFGGNLPRLFAITLKKGARIFAAISMTNPQEQALIKSAAEAFGCKNPDAGASQSTTIDTMVARFRNSTDPTCRQLIIDAFSKLDVQAILYGYSAANSLDGCRERSEALNIVSSQAIDFERINYYSPSKDIESVSMVDQISRLYRESVDDFNVRWTSPQDQLSSPLATTTAQPLDDDAYREWRNANIFKCGRAWSPERFADGIDMASGIRRAFYRREIGELLLKTKRGFQARVTGPNSWSVQFDPTRINVIERMEYRLTGLPADFSKFPQFLAAKNALNDYKLTPEERSRKIGELLDEPGAAVNYATLQSDLMNYVTSLSAEQRNSPNALFALFNRMQIGPRQALISINQLTGAFGSTPFIATAPSLDLGPSSLANYEANITVFKRLLEKCGEIYSDQRLTLEQIQAGSCGVRQLPVN